MVLLRGWCVPAAGPGGYYPSWASSPQSTTHPGPRSMDRRTTIYRLPTTLYPSMLNTQHSTDYAFGLCTMHYRPRGTDDGKGLVTATSLQMALNLNLSYGRHPFRPFPLLPGSFRPLAGTPPYHALTTTRYSPEHLLKINFSSPYRAGPGAYATTSPPPPSWLL
jgi:hypothetical protein